MLARPPRRLSMGRLRRALSLGTALPALLLALALGLGVGPPPRVAAQAGLKGGAASFSRDVLPGGLTLLVEERPGSGLVAVNVGVLAGARYEPDDAAGAAQFMSQLFLDGTPSRPSRRDVLGAITSRGGDLNVDAGWELVSLSAEMASEDVDVALDVLADLLLNSAFARDRFEAERTLILQNLVERADNPARLFSDVAYATALGEPDLRHVPAGSPDTISSLAYDNLLRYRAAQVVGGNTIVAVAGDVRRDDVLPRVQRYFAALPPGPRQQPRPLPRVVPPPLVTRAAGSEQSNVAVAARTPGVESADRAALVVLSGLLGGGGQRLYTEIRDKRGLAYVAGASLLQMPDAGVLLAYAGTEPGNTDEVADLLRGEVERLVDEPASDDEVAHAISYFVDGQIVDLETDSARAGDLVRRESLYGTAPPREYFLEMIREVRPADVQAAARRYLTPDRLTTVILGPDQ
ncbi:MAG TPA: pitrilysin family protein [Chloroflexota bacterium]|nr:pitrilysin family protein [Chloroflexota bacterium]